MKGLTATVAIGALAASMPAWGQTGQTVPDAPSASADAPTPPIGTNGDTQSPAATPATGLSDIVVTAQRRSENLQRTAVPVNVVTGNALTQNSITTPTQLGTLVPALSIQNPGGANTTFFIRGVGNFSVNGYTDPAVAFNYDGVYLGRSTSPSGLLYDLERVEVLKGPQGTLYGRNATAGAINVIPTRPTIGETTGFLNGSYGNYDAYNLQGALNLPIGEIAAVRVAGTVVGHDGYLSDGTSDQKERAVRAQLLARPTPDLTLRIGADYAHDGGKGGGSTYANRYVFNRATGSYVVTNSGLGYGTGLLDPRAQAFRRASYAGLPGRTLGPLDSDVYLDNRYFGVNGEINWTTPVGTLTVLPAYRGARLDNRFDVPGFIGFVQEHDDQFSIEARFTGRRISIFDYIVGAYYFDEKVRGNYSFSQDALEAFQDFTSKTKSYAAFARLTANLSDRLRLTGGVRYTQDRKNFDGTANVVLVTCTLRVNGLPACPTAPVLPVVDTPGELPFPITTGGVRPIGTTGALAVSAVTRVQTPLRKNRATYRAAAEFDVGPHSLLYASFENGFRSGGFALAVGHETFQPEYLDAYTIGFKNRLFDNRLQINVETFLWKYRDQQVSHTGVDLAGNTGNFTDNVGRSTNKGVEIDTQFLLTRNTLLSADVQYLDAHYKSFVYAQPVGTAPPFSGCAYAVSAQNTALYNVDCSGKRSFQSPKWTINLGARQTVPIGDYKAVGSVDTQYKTRYYSGFDYVAYQLAPSTWTTNAQINFGPSSDSWSVGVFVRNIEDHRTPVFTSNFGLGGLGMTVTSPPRTYGARFNVKF